MSRSQIGITGYQLAYQSNLSDPGSNRASGSGGEFVDVAADDDGGDDTAVVNRLDLRVIRELGEMGRLGLEKEHLKRGFVLRIRSDGRAHAARAASMALHVKCFPQSRPYNDKRSLSLSDSVSRLSKLVELGILQPQFPTSVAGVFILAELPSPRMSCIGMIAV